MTNNVLVLCDPERQASEVAQLAARSGDSIGLVSTVLRPAEVRAVGCRVEEERDYGGVSVQAFDEPIIAGAAVAQLSAIVDAIIVHHLGVWAERLAEHFGDARDRLEMELASVTSVMTAGLTDIVLVSTPPSAEDTPAARLHRWMLDTFRPHCTEVLDLTSSATSGA
jgi:hypothetical protein